MSEQPTREEIEWALKNYYATHPNSIIGILCRAARAYLASLDAPAPSVEDALIENGERFLAAMADTGSLKDG